MSNRLGMDAGLVRGYADQMDGLADDLASIANSVNAAVGRLSSVWLGADAQELAQRWQFRDRDGVAALEAHIRDLARTARVNAAEQDRASGVTSTVGGGVGPVVGRGVLDSVERDLGRVNSVLGVPDDITRLDKLLRTEPWTSRAVLHAESLWHDSVPVVAGAGAAVLSRLHISPKAAAVWAERGGTAVKALGVVGLGVTAGTKGVDAVDDFRSGRNVDGALDVSDVVAAGLKSSDNPYAYAGGVIVSEYTDVVRMARQVDWSQPRPAWTASNLEHIYAPALGDAVKSLPGHIFSWVS